MPEILPLLPADPNRVATLSRLTQELLADITRVPIESRAREALQATRELLDEYADDFLTHITEKLISFFELIQNGPLDHKFADQLTGSIYRALRDQAKNIEWQLEDHSSPKVRNRIAGHLARMQEAVMTDRSFEAAAKAQQAVADARSTFGVTALGSVTNVTAEELDKELGAARWTRALAIFALIASVVSAGLLIGEPPDSPYAAISHYGITFSLVLLSGYLARESSQHRFVSRELRYHQARIRSVLLFSASFESATQRADFLTQAGNLLFTTPFAQPGSSQVQGLPSDQLEALLAKIADIVKSARSGA